MRLRPVRDPAGELTNYSALQTPDLRGRPAGEGREEGEIGRGRKREEIGREGGEWKGGRGAGMKGRRRRGN